MLKLNDIEVEKTSGHQPNTFRYSARVTLAAEFMTAPEDINRVDEFDEVIKTDLKKGILQKVYGDISDDVVRVAQRIMGEVQDPALSASLYADLEILYEKLNQHESE